MEKAMKVMRIREASRLRARASPQKEVKQMLQAISLVQMQNIQVPPIVRLGMILHMEIQMHQQEMTGMRSCMIVRQEKHGTQKTV